MIHKTTTIATIENLKKQIDHLLPIKKEDEIRLWQKYNLEFNYNSNHLEGNTLTYGQTELLLLHGKSSGNVKVSDIEEMKAHDLALSQIVDLAKEFDRPLTEQFIKELNKTILVKDYWKNAITHEGEATRKKIEVGKYKSTPNHVETTTGKIHYYATPEDTPILMAELLKWYNSNEDKMHPVQLSAEVHYRFVCIHPFDDGNGRVARLLMNYILLKNDYPPVIIKSADKENYLTALQKADAGERIEIIEYIEKQMIWSLEMKINAAKGESLHEQGDIDKEIALLKREKLTEVTIYNSPSVCYELIKYVDEEVWGSLVFMLKKFDTFFSETKSEKYIDGLKVEKKEIRKSPFNFADRSDKEAVVTPHIIFDHDFDETDAKTIKWQWQMLGLKSASTKKHLGIELTIKLENSSYTIKVDEVSLGSATAWYSNVLQTSYNQERPYNSYLNDSDINQIVEKVSQGLLKKIKNEK